MSHFTAEFIEYCVAVSVPLRRFLKIPIFRAKLLAMQRAAL
jgi:hypothetical protein